MNIFNIIVWVLVFIMLFYFMIKYFKLKNKIVTLEESGFEDDSKTARAMRFQNEITPYIVFKDNKIRLRVLKP